MKQLFEEEDEKKEEEEDKDEENPTESEEQVQQISPKTPSKRVQKNHHSDQIIGNKEAGVETRRKIHSPEQTHLALLSTIEPNCFEEWESLTLMWTKEYLLVTQVQGKNTSVTI